MDNAKVRMYLRRKFTDVFARHAGFDVSGDVGPADGDNFLFAKIIVEASAIAADHSCFVCSFAFHGSGSDYVAKQVFEGIKEQGRWKLSRVSASDAHFAEPAPASKHARDEGWLLFCAFCAFFAAIPSPSRDCDSTSSRPARPTPIFLHFPVKNPLRPPPVFDAISSLVFP